MQANEFRKLVNRVVEGIKAKELRDFLSFIPQAADSQITSEKKDKFSNLIIGAMQAISKLNDDPGTSQVIESMKLNEVMNAESIGKMISAFQNSTSKAQLQQHHQQDITRFFALHAALENFVRLQNLVNSFLEHEEIKNPSVIELHIFDFNGDGVPAEVIANGMQSLRKIVDVLDRIYNTKGESRIVAIESGSDVSVWVAVGQTITALNIFLQDAWNLIVFHKINKFDRKVDSIANAVTVIGDIEKKVSDGSLDRDTAEQLKKSLFDGAMEMFDNQMCPANINLESHENARKLLESHKETKLLTEGNDGTDQGTGESSPA
ncbi:MAG TPA: hypothetical protein VFO76_08190 [Candidatus Kapabacteria bacterium]|nr:hypothetical protein [Candidatus Kapabacteria bacterium]